VEDFAPFLLTDGTRTRTIPSIFVSAESLDGVPSLDVLPDVSKEEMGVEDAGVAPGGLALVLVTLSAPSLFVRNCAAGLLCPSSQTVDASPDISLLSATFVTLRAFSFDLSTGLFTFSFGLST
jgi:hypothetical protein